MRKPNGRQLIIEQVSEDLAYHGEPINRETAQAAVDSYLTEMRGRNLFGAVGWYWQRSTDSQRRALYTAIAREAAYRRQHIASVPLIEALIFDQFGLWIGQKARDIRDALYERNPMTGREYCRWDADGISYRNYLNYDLTITRETVTFDGHTETIEDWNRVHGPKEMITTEANETA